MSVKSIIDIEMNDSAFQRFSQLFEKYNSQLQATRPAWTQVRGEVQLSAQAFDRMSAALMAQTALQAKLAREQKTATQHTQASAKSWHDIFRTTAGVAQHIKDATLQFARWTGMLSAFGGILGAGGLFGIERLAGAATGLRKTAMGFGMTPGEVSAMKIDYGQVFDPNMAEQGIYNALHDVTERWKLSSLGVSQQAIQSNDPFKVMTDLMQRLPQMTKGWSPAAVTNLMQAYGLDKIMTPQQLQMWNAMSPQERGQLMSQAQVDAQRLNLTNRTTEAYQRLYAQLQRAGAEIENVFIKGLVPLTKPLTDLSQGFVNLVQAFAQSPVVKGWIEDIAQALNRFSNVISSPKFATDVQQFTAWVGTIMDDAKNIGITLFNFGEAVEQTASWVTSILPKTANQSLMWKRGAEGAALGAGAGALGLGPFGMAGGALLGGAAGVGEGYVEGLLKGSPLFQKWMSQPENYHWDYGLGMNMPGVQRQSWMGGANVSGLLHNIGYGQGGGNPWADLVYSVMQQESGGNPLALSKTGAMGLMQLEPGTAAAMGVTNPWDPRQNLLGGAKYLMQQLDTFHGDIKEGLAAYNAGPGAVESAVKQYGPDWLSHMKPETRDYVPSILRRMLALQTAQSGQRIRVENNTGGSAIISSSQLVQM